MKHILKKKAFDLERQLISEIGIENLCNISFGGGGCSRIIIGFIKNPTTTVVGFLG